MNPNSAIVVAIPKQNTRLILQQSDAILELKRMMKKGVHYGAPYPGSDKETLLKPGAEWLAKRFGLRSHYEEVTRQIDIDFDRPWRTFILFEYRCTMIDIETGVSVGEAIGFANSREDKYAWRWVNEYDTPPGMDKDVLVSKDGTVSEFAFAVDKGETSGQYGKPAEYWQQFRDAIENRTARPTKRKARSGKELDAWEIGGRLYRVPHDNPLDLLNTLSKMCQKRAKVSSVMEATGASSYFAPGDDEVTDIYVAEDDIGVIDAEFEEVKPHQPQNGHEPDSVRVEQSSAKVVGVQPNRPTPPPVSVAESPAPNVASGDDPLADFGTEQGDPMPHATDPREADDLNLYHCDRLKVHKTKTATQYILFVQKSATRINVTSPIVFEGLTINGAPIIELPAGEYPLDPSWSVRADSDGKSWDVHSIEAEMAF